MGLLAQSHDNNEHKLTLSWVSGALTLAPVDGSG